MSDSASDADSALYDIIREFRIRVRDGEDPDVEGYAARHPEISGIREMLLAARELERDSARRRGWVGRRVGDYDILRQIGQGGMGVVYEARQVSLNRTVALKKIRAGGRAGEADVRRFRLEAEAAAGLDHRGIVPIYQIGQHDGEPYFSMGLVEGISLAQRLADGPLSPRDAAALMVEVADAIEYAHSRGVIHRDLKPTNILLDRGGNPRVTDFGLARKVQADSSLTGSGQIVGTPDYMPPEQTGGGRGKIGPTADVYALGATLYEIVAGRPPFQAAKVIDILWMVLNDEPVPPRQLNASMPRDLETICLKCLEKDPERRYSSAEELREDLQRYLDDKPIRARRATSWERAFRCARRNPGTTKVAAASVLVVLAILYWGVPAYLQSRRSARTFESQARLSGYAAQFQRAWQAWWEGRDVFAVRDILETLRPERTGGTDLRGAEWYCLSGQVPTELFAHRDPGWKPTALAVSPDGSRLAIGGRGSVRILDGKTGAPIATVAAEDKEIRALDFTGDGRLVAATFPTTRTGIAGNPTAWDVGRGLELSHRPFNAHLLAFEPTGRRFAYFESTGGSGYLGLDDLESGRPIAHQVLSDIVNGSVLFPGRLVFSPAGELLAYTDGFGLWLWDLASGLSHKVHRPSSGCIGGLAFTADGEWLATSESGGIRFWDARARMPLNWIQTRDDAYGEVAFSRDKDKRWVACVRDEKVVKVWAASDAARSWGLSAGELALTLRCDSPVAGLAFTPEGNLAIATRDGWFRVWKVRPNNYVMRRGVGSLHDLGLGGRPDELWDRPVVSGFNVRTRESLRGLVDWYELRGSIAPLPETGVELIGPRVAVTLVRLDPRSDVTAVLDIQTGRSIPILPADPKLHMQIVSFDRSGRRVAALFSPSGGRDTVAVWEEGSGQIFSETLDRVARAQGPRSSQDYRLILSPDGKHLALTNPGYAVRPEEEDRCEEIRVWAVDSGAALSWPRAGGPRAFAVAFSPDGREIVTGSSDGRIRVWDLQTGTIRPAPGLREHSDRITCLAFSPDGRRVASGGGERDRTIVLWDATTWEKLLTLRGHDHEVQEVAFSQDGRRLVSLSLVDRFGTRFWNIKP